MKALPVTVFVVLAVVITAPLFLSPELFTFPATTSQWDAALYRWAAWWVGESLDHGQSFLQTDLMFYPHGESLDLFPGDWSYAILLQPIVWAFGVPEGLNLHYAASLLVSFAAAGLFMYWLAREVGLSRTAALLAGIVFEVSGLRMCYLAQPNILVSEFLPLLLVLYLRLVRRPSAVRLIALGFSAGLLFYNSRELTNHAMLMLGGWFLVSLLLPQWRGRTVRAVPALAAAAVITVILGLPLLVRLRFSGSAASFAANAAGFLPLGSLDLLAPFVPHAGDALYGNLLGGRPLLPFEAKSLAPGETAASLFLGFSVLGLMAAALVTGKWRRAGAWIALAMCFYVLALGPMLKVSGKLHTVWLPYAALYKIYAPLRLSRVPLRFMSVASVGFALWAAWGLEGLRARLSTRPRAAALVSVAFMGLILAESSERIPIDMGPARYPVPAGYRRIGEDREARSLLELPYNLGKLNRLTLYYQTVHHKPIYVCEYPRAEWRRRPDLEANAFFGYLLGIQKAAGRQVPRQAGPFVVGPPDDLRAVRAAIREWGVKYVTLHEGIAGRAVRFDVPRAIDALREALRDLQPAEEWVEVVQGSYRVRFFRMF